MVWNSASRLLSEQEAVSRVHQMVTRVRARISDEDALWGKRIDSTLRGHVAAETEAMMDALPNLDCAVVVAAFPASGRVVRAGQLLVHGVPVNETEIAQDPYTPVLDADVCRVLRGRAARPVHRLPLDLLEAPNEARRSITGWLQAGDRPLLVCDAVSQADIEAWANLFAGLSIRILSVDPGPFTTAYMAAKQRLHRHVLVVSGSVMPTSVQQLDALEAAYDLKLVRVRLDRLLDPVSRRTEHAERVAEVLAGLKRHNVVGFRTDGAAPPTQVEGRAITRAIAELALDILDHVAFQGLYVSGGEVAYETLQALGVRALEPLLQICPLGVLSRVVDGPRGLYIVTKGGSVGHPEALVDSVRLLLSTMDEPNTGIYTTGGPHVD